MLNQSYDYNVYFQFAIYVVYLCDESQAINLNFDRQIGCLFYSLEHLAVILTFAIVINAKKLTIFFQVFLNFVQSMIFIQVNFKYEL